MANRHAKAPDGSGNDGGREHRPGKAQPQKQPQSKEGKAPDASHQAPRSAGGKQGKKASGHTHSQPAAAPSLEEQCEASKAQCSAIRKASSEAKHGSKPQPQERCPAGTSREECAAIVKVVEESAGASTPMHLEECPPSFSQEMCEAAMKASYEAYEANH